MRGAIIALLLLVAACGPLPHPFEHPAGSSGYPLAALTIDVRVTPVAGLPGPTGEAVAQAVAESLGAYGVTATTRSGTDSRFVLEGSYNDPEPDAPPPHGTLIVWTLFDADGEATGIHTQAVDAALAAGTDAATLRATGTAPAKALAGLIGADAELPAVDTAARAGLFLAGISGAPGDGDTALAIALRLVLADSGLGSASTADSAAYILHGTVTVEPPRDGGQPVEIRWQVTTRDGNELGEAVQRNAVPAGRLDSHWGAIAGLAARAAVDGIADIVNRAREGDPAPRQAITLPPSAELPAPPRSGAKPVTPAPR